MVINFVQNFFAIFFCLITSIAILSVISRRRLWLLLTITSLRLLRIGTSLWLSYIISLGLLATVRFWLSFDTILIDIFPAVCGCVSFLTRTFFSNHFDISFNYIFIFDLFSQILALASYFCQHKKVDHLPAIYLALSYTFTLSN